MILANGNGKTLVQNIRNKANKAARKILLRLYIFSFPLSLLIKSYNNYGYWSYGKKIFLLQYVIKYELNDIVRLFTILILLFILNANYYSSEIKKKD